MTAAAVTHSQPAGLRRLIWPAITTAVMLALLLALGSWQIRRLAWKQGLLAEIDRAEALPPIPLPADPPPFAKVAASGTLRGDQAVFYGVDVRDRPQAVMGAQLVVPLERQGQKTVLVDLGWIPSDHGPPPPGKALQAEVTGYIRFADRPGLFSPRDDIGGRRFYTLDAAAIGAALGLSDVAPYVLVALGPEGGNALPEPAHALPRPVNNHLQYAITWYGLAGVLAVIFLSWCSKVLRDERHPERRS